MLTDEGREFLEKNEIKNYTINSDGMIDVDWFVEIKTKQSKFPVKFGRVAGSFNCYEAGLTSLAGAPSYIGGNFYCQFNQLTSLEGAPSYVGGSFYCYHNQLTSLHDIHKHIKEIDGDIYCYDNPIKDSVLGLFLIKGIRGVDLNNYKVQDILNKYIKTRRAGVIGAQQELLDAGLDEYARL